MRNLMLVFAVLVCFGPAASAQEPGQAGLTFGTPGDLGFIYHVNDIVAVRPEFAIATGSGALDTTSWNLGASGIFYVRRWDALRAYVSPRFTYGQSSASSDTVDTSASNYQFAGSFGAQYAVHKRFSIFGETGFAVIHVNSEPSSSTGVGTRSSVGAIFYFN